VPLQGGSAREPSALSKGTPDVVTQPGMEAKAAIRQARNRGDSRKGRQPSRRRGAEGVRGVKMSIGRRSPVQELQQLATETSERRSNALRLRLVRRGEIQKDLYYRLFGRAPVLVVGQEGRGGEAFLIDEVRVGLVALTEAGLGGGGGLLGPDDGRLPVDHGLARRHGFHGSLSAVRHAPSAHRASGWTEERKSRGRG